MRSKWLAGAATIALLAGLISAGSAALTSATASASAASDAAKAVSYASQHGYRSSIGVLDTQTGTFSGAGDYNSAYASESVMKVFIATRLLMTGQMSGWNATTAYKMITQSDDASANALYGRVGGDSVITWVKQALNIPNLGSPPLRSGWWGGTQITAVGMATFYNKVRHLPGVWNWLGNAMHHATTYGSDGTYQFFGIPSATTGAAIKQGWGADNAAGQPAFNSTGLVNGDRFAVVILTQGGSYGSAIAGMLTSEARLLMPGGRIANDDPFGGVSSWSLAGRYLTVTGWALDPDALSTPLRIFFYVNGKPFTYVQTTVPRGDINAAYQASGNHGFSKSLMLSDGSNTVCAYAINVGAGGNTQLGCRSVPLTGVPLGGISAAGQRGSLVTLTGWAFDYDAPDTPLLVRAYVDGSYAGGVLTTLLRPDIDVALHGTGSHGFAIVVSVPTGVSSICLYALNRGYGSTGRLGCARATLAQSPLGILDPVTVEGNVATVSGWTLDFDDAARSIGALVNVGATHVAWGYTGVARPDVNQAWRVSGVHGFSYRITLPAGSSRVCAYGINIGPGRNSLLGCQTVTVAASTGNPATALPGPSPAGSGPAATAPSTAPARTAPASTVPLSTAPAATAPATTGPSASVPSTTAPSASVPSTAPPSSAVPSSAVPSASPTGR